MSARPLLLLLALTFAGPPAASAQAVFERVFTDLPTFGWTPAFRTAGNGDNRFYVVEQAGRISSFVREPDVSEAPLFLDVTDRVFYDLDTHPGMLSLAFHPDYATNGFFYVTYIADPNEDGTYSWRLSRFSADFDPLTPVADPDSEVILLDVPASLWEHTGGDLHFGPDGYLYVSIGDTRCCGDPEENAQDRTTLPGSILRLDVDNAAPGLHYGIPPDNPFVGNAEGWREEIWAYGFRNPWRFSVDPVTGQVWVGDVGNFVWEEVGLVEAGQNHGWDDMEGPECFEVPACDPDDYTLPVWSYDHSVGISVIGGYVYRGDLVPDLYGQYIFADWGTHDLWALDYDPDSGDPAEVTLLADDIGTAVSSFGVDDDGELYAIRTFTGEFWKMVPEPPVPTEPPPAPEVTTLRLWPNPVATTLHLEWPPALERTAVAIYDVLGRRVFEVPVVPGSTRANLDVTPLRPGAYVVRTGAFMQTFTVAR